MHEGWMTIGPTSHACGMTVEQLRKLADRGVVEFRRLGQNRLFPAASLDQIRRAGIEAGYVAATEGTVQTVAR